MQLIQFFLKNEEARDTLKTFPNADFPQLIVKGLNREWTFDVSLGLCRRPIEKGNRWVAVLTLV